LIHCKYRESKRNVEASAFLTDVRGRQIDHNLVGRKKKAARSNRGVNPFSRFLYRAICEPHNMDAALRGWHADDLDAHQVRFDASKCCGIPNR